MNIYHYSGTTGEYLGTSVADADPLTPNAFLIPACSTTVEPPTAPAGQVAVFSNNQWALFNDFRGTQYWTEDAISHTVTAIGPLPSGAILVAPPAPAPNQRITYSNGAWAETPDFIGQKYWNPDGSEVTVTALGPLPDGVTQIAPPDSIPAQYALSFTNGAWTLVPTTYYTKRAAAYPALGDLFDLIWHAIDQGLPLDKSSAFYAACAAVKNEFPKPVKSTSTT